MTRCCASSPRRGLAPPRSAARAGTCPRACRCRPAGPRRPLLACGAQLKNTFCVAKGERAWVGHHVGDLSNYETLRSFTEGIEHFERLFAVTPEVVAHDLHPEYLSTKYAFERDDVELIGVQHHHAHLAACLAEHGEPGSAIGAIFDGSGYGTDGTVWGGELLCRRHHEALPARARCGRSRLPGGERAIREPWRMACAWLTAAADDEEVALPPALEPHVDRRIWGQIARLVAEPVRAAHEQHRPAVRRRRGAVRNLPARQLRGPGGDRARGGLRPRRARVLRDRAGRSRRSHDARSARDRSPRWPPTPPPVRRWARSRAASHDAVARVTVQRLCAGGVARGHRAGRPVGRRLPEPPAARGDGAGAPAGWAAGARPGAPSCQRRRHLVRPGGGRRGADRGRR